MLYFTSDQHYFHSRVLELIPHRPWKTLDEMHNGLIDRHNSLVTDEDVLVILGDFIMGKKAQSIPAILPRLTGRKYLLLGNHDAGFHHGEHNADDKLGLYLTNGLLGFDRGCLDLATFLESMGEDTNEIPYGLDINICHFPYRGVEEHAACEERLAAFKPIASETLLLHGHTHSIQDLTAANMIHIGVDAWEWSPVSLEQVLSLYATVHPG